MRIATWNVNSVKARLPNVTGWLTEVKPDVAVLQEIKCETAAFPVAAFTDIGYQCLVVGQKAYNGVALLSRLPFTPVLERLPGEEETDPQARYLEADVAGVRVCGLYLPNGNPLGTEKFDYKIRWMERLRARAAALLQDGLPFLLTGDFNVIPEARDVYDPAGFAAKDALFQPETLRQWRSLLNLGLTDAYRALHDDAKAYTFWDYQAGCWPRDLGLRIDHFLLSPQLTDRLAGCCVDRGPRAAEKASDHTPVLLDLSD
jgi:exodeoxyribonuclease III